MIINCLFCLLKYKFTIFWKKWLNLIVANSLHLFSSFHFVVKRFNTTPGIFVVLCNCWAESHGNIDYQNQSNTWFLVVTSLFFISLHC